MLTLINAVVAEDAYCIIDYLKFHFKVFVRQCSHLKRARRLFILQTDTPLVQVINIGTSPGHWSSNLLCVCHTSIMVKTKPPDDFTHLSLPFYFIYVNGVPYNHTAVSSQEPLIKPGCEGNFS